MADIAYPENAELNQDIANDEIVLMVCKLKNNKACGIDGIPNEILKQRGVISILTEFMNMCFKYNLIPSLWTKSIIKPIPKSATKDPCVPLNYRGISLLSCVSKLMSGIMNDRICKYYDRAGLMVDEQNGFRKNRSCEEHIFTLTSIIRNRKGVGLPTFVAFIDLEKAFDRVDRTLLLYRLLCYNIDGKIYKIIKRMYTNTTSCLKLNNHFTDWFDVSSGVRQGDNLSPTLFSLLINDLATHINQLNKGIQVGQDNISILLYADDMVLISENERDLQIMLVAMNKWTDKWRLKVNIAKSKIVHFRPKRRPRTRFVFVYDGGGLDIVISYRYLGIYLDEHLNFDFCTQILSESAGRALGGIISKFKTLKDCGYKTYTKLFVSGVIPILNYGSGIWGFGKYPKCDHILNRAMRYFLGVHRYAPTAGIQGVVAWLSLKYRRYIEMMRFWNRLVKMDDTRLTKRVFLWYYDHPRHNWCTNIEHIAVHLDVTNVYTNKCLFNIHDIERKCMELMYIEWRNDVLDKPKLRTYNEMKFEFVVEPYVYSFIPKHIRSIFAQFRVGILPLQLETGRFVNIVDPQTGVYRKMTVEERLCKICNEIQIEDEKHFIFVCKEYAYERRKLYDHCIISLPNFENLSIENKLKHLVTSEWKYMANYVYNIWQKRKCKLYI